MPSLASDPVFLAAIAAATLWILLPSATLHDRRRRYAKCIGNPEVIFRDHT